MPQRENCLPVTFSSLKALRDFLSSYDGSWRDLVWEFNGQVSVSTLRRIESGHYIPKRLQTLKALHLPARVEVVCCPLCGQPPLSKRHKCTSNVPEQASKPRKPPKAVRRKRLIHDERWRMCQCVMIIRRERKP